MTTISAMLQFDKIFTIVMFRLTPQDVIKRCDVLFIQTFQRNGTPFCVLFKDWVHNQKNPRDFGGESSLMAVTRREERPVAYTGRS